MLDVGDIIGITEVFVITSGSNVRQVKTIAEEIEHQLKDEGHGEADPGGGPPDATWVLIDYGDFVVHVFQETRAFYDLERLWGDAPRIGWDEAAAAVS